MYLWTLREARWSHRSGEDELVAATRKGLGGRLIDWVDSRIGLTNTMLRPAPDYSLSPFYWLGALTVVAFIMQGLVGFLMLVYYVPTPEQAYPTTQFIMDNVPYGSLLESLHLYGAYAMILLAFVHMMREFFVSAYKGRRELMWIVGTLMGFTVLGFGFTGYLLPWTVVSKSATDVGLGMITNLPPQIVPFLNFLIMGTGGDAAELLRFFEVHILLLPSFLLLLLVAKMYMFEIHGIAEPPERSDLNATARMTPWFPTVAVYMGMLSAVFVAVMLVVSSLFPISLPPEYSPTIAGEYVAQPEWYFLWLYQVLKISLFEGEGIRIALSGIAGLAALLVLFPFLDQAERKSPLHRPLHTTIGLIIIAELVTLTVWGFFTPGEVIPTSNAVLVLAGLILVIAAIVLILRRTGLFVKSEGQDHRGQGVLAGTRQHPVRLSIGLKFVALLCFGSYSMYVFADGISTLWFGPTSRLANLVVGGVLLASSLLAMTRLVYIVEGFRGNIKRTFAIFEEGKPA
jgi:quinol-cytochrome oxidoreductase complex cytochrome b subunit